MTRITHGERQPPAGILLEDYTEDVEIGLLKTGKEADVYLVERIGPHGSCLLAEKRYRPPEERAFRNDLAYRAHRRNDGLRRDVTGLRRPKGGRSMQLAMDKRTRYGKQVLAVHWVAAEFEALRRLWLAGASVPYPVACRDDGVLMEYVGDHDEAAPRLAQARVDRAALPGLFEQVRENLRIFARTGMVHADLSAYNVLLWQGRTWIIDLPQAVPYLENLDATDFLHRDVHNICAWFVRKGMNIDPEEVFAELLNDLFDYRMEDLFRAH